MKTKMSNKAGGPSLPGAGGSAARGRAAGADSDMAALVAALWREVEEMHVSYEAQRGERQRQKERERGGRGGSADLPSNGDGDGDGDGSEVEEGSVRE